MREVEPGMVTAASVLHPLRGETELLAAGIRLDGRLIKRLREQKVERVWVHHDAVADLDRVVNPRMGRARQATYDQLKRDFAKLSAGTITAGQAQAYRRVIMDLVCELMSHRGLAGFTELLAGDGSDLFSHGANVAYFALIAGLELETYLVSQRSKLAAEHARDVTALGIGAMLHDIGKAGLGQELAELHEEDLASLDPGSDLAQQYLEHPRRGYQMLRGSRAPASSTQVVLAHHRGFDGSGFPEIGVRSEQRHAEPMAGERIHVFSRIVSVANTLDKRLREARAAGSPAVAALRALATGPYEQTLDPVVRDMLLRRVPPFAVGASVRLSNGKPAAVIAPSLEQPCRPVVRLLSPADRLPDGAYPTLDLREHPALRITEAQGQDVAPHLFALPARPPLATMRYAG